MCVSCGCNKSSVGKLDETLTGKPQDPYGQYDGVGGTK
jgi:hypothetical protein